MIVAIHLPTKPHITQPVSNGGFFCLYFTGQCFHSAPSLISGGTLKLPYRINFHASFFGGKKKPPPKAGGSKNASQECVLVSTL